VKEDAAISYYKLVDSCENDSNCREISFDIPLFTGYLNSPFPTLTSFILLRTVQICISVTASYLLEIVFLMRAMLILIGILLAI
jgi:hypothetical protein